MYVLYKRRGSPETCRIFVVECVRTEKGARQKILSYLGSSTNLSEQKRLTLLGNRLIDLINTGKISKAQAKEFDFDKLPQTNSCDISMDSLIDEIANFFSAVSDPRKNRVTYDLKDVLMSAFAMFNLKYPSLLKYEEERKRQGVLHSNLKEMYHLKNIPSDTQMREILDRIEPSSIEPIFREIMTKLLKLNFLDQFTFTFLDGKPYYLLSVDATGFFSSHSVHCKNCLTKNSKNDLKRTRYEHQMLAATIVHPAKKIVLPICAEFVCKQDGETKDDCEQNAFNRLMKKIKKEYPDLNFIINADALYASENCKSLLEDLGYQYLIAVKSTKHKTLFRSIEDYKKMGEIKYDSYEEQCGIKVKKTVKHSFHFKKGVYLTKNSKKKDANFIDYTEETFSDSKKDELKYQKRHFSWITSLPLDNSQSRKKIMKGGRSRWKIENETFNTLKNQGYHFDHNFGHGYIYLSSILALMMLLAFFADQIQQESSSLFQKALTLLDDKRSKLWERLKFYYETFSLNSYSNLLETIIKVRSPHYCGIFKLNTS